MLIALCIAGLVAALDSWFSYSSFATVVPSGPLTDFTIVGYSAYLLLKLQRNLAIGTLIAGILFLGGTLCMIQKYFFTWSPVSFGDLLLLKDLFGFYGTVPLVAAGAVLFAFVALFLYNFRLPGRRDMVVVAPALLVAILLATKVAIPEVAAAAERSAAFLRNDKSGPLYYGHWGTLASSTYRYAGQYAEARRLQDAFKDKADVFPDFTAGKLADVPPRNVYIVLIESLFNPHEIKGLTFDREPLAPPFDSWFKRGGAHAMSPVFGGRSADAEFEILCGLPVDFADGDVLFARLQAKEIDCLPAKLRRLGWNTVSTVPVPGSFFSAESAYRRIGFAQSIFIDQLDGADHDGEMISAESLLQQQMSTVDRLLAEKRPFLNYVFMTSGHFPYALDPVKRPTVIKVNPSDPLVEDYVNAAYYNMLAVGRYIEEVRRRDPTALIVTLGDHPPILFATHEGYPGDAGRTRHVPLMIFDGTAGEVPLQGWYPDYHLPEIILDRLTGGRFCAANKCYGAERNWVRPNSSGVTLIDAAAGTLRPCDAAAPECAAAAQEVDFWRSRIYALIGLP